MPSESEILSAMAITNNEAIMLSLGLPLLLKPTINAKQVIIADVAPKLNFVSWTMRKEEIFYSI